MLKLISLQPGTQCLAEPGNGLEGKVLFCGVHSPGATDLKDGPTHLAVVCALPALHSGPLCRLVLLCRLGSRVKHSVLRPQISASGMEIRKMRPGESQLLANGPLLTCIRSLCCEASVGAHCPAGSRDKKHFSGEILLPFLKCQTQGDMKCISKAHSPLLGDKRILE